MGASGKGGEVQSDFPGRQVQERTHAAYEASAERSAKHGKSWAVANLILDDALRIAKADGFWDEAMAACKRIQRIKPEYGKYYAAESRACRVDKKGKSIEATKERVARDRRPGPGFTGSRKDWSPCYGALRHYADVFASLGAWRLYNEAVVAPVRIGQSPHTTRQAMAKLMLKENRPDQAVEVLITGICEAEKWAEKRPPKSIKTEPRRALRASGLNEDGLAEEIVSACKEQGERYARHLLNSRKKST